MPGWQVRLPADAKGPGVHTVRVAIDTPTPVQQDDKLSPNTKDTKEKVTPKVTKPAAKTSTDVKPGTGTRWFEEEGTERPSSISIGSDPAVKDTKPADPSIDVTQPHGPGTTEAQPGDPAAGGTKVPDVVVESDSGISATEAGIYGFGATLLAAGLAVALKRRRGWALGPGPKAARAADRDQPAAGGRRTDRAVRGQLAAPAGREHDRGGRV